MSDLQSQSGQHEDTSKPLEETPSEDEAFPAKDVEITGKGILYTVATMIGDGLLGGIGL